MSDIKTTVTSFTVSRGSHYVVVREDDELTLKFKRGEVTPGDSGRMTVLESCSGARPVSAEYRPEGDPCWHRESQSG